MVGHVAPRDRGGCINCAVGRALWNLYEPAGILAELGVAACLRQRWTSSNGITVAKSSQTGITSRQHTVASNYRHQDRHAFLESPRIRESFCALSSAESLWAPAEPCLCPSATAPQDAEALGRCLLGPTQRVPEVRHESTTMQSPVARPRASVPRPETSTHYGRNVSRDPTAATSCLVLKRR